MGKLVRLVTAGVGVAVLGALVLSRTAAADLVEHHGAIAHSDAPGHWGHAFVGDQATEKAAAEKAVANCQINVGPGNNCHLVLHWHNACGAIAESDDKQSHGWGTGGDRKAAEKHALDACIGSGGPGTGSCKIRDTGCTGI